jgi:hypothetical protein
MILTRLRGIDSVVVPSELVKSRLVSRPNTATIRAKNTLDIDRPLTEQSKKSPTCTARTDVPVDCRM